MAGVIAGLGRVMAEVGSIIIVGGNIAGYTRVMTTTIALETDKGNFELAIALGIILLTISFAITVALRFFQRLGRTGTAGKFMGLELEIAHVFKTYNGNPILRDCSMAFGRGRTYVLQGPNGSGKSTLFRILALLEPPDRGQVEYRADGQVLAADLNLRRRITLVLPEHRHLQYHGFPECGLRPEGQRGEPRRRSRRGSMPCWPPWAWPIRSFSGPWSSPAARPSAWELPGPWSSRRKSSCWMNPPPISTR